jgi:hypothetical protein
MTHSPRSDESRGHRYLSAAAATAFLTGASRVRVGTVLRWAAYVAIPVVPTMVELAGWNVWQKLPTLPTFHLIYWWAGLVCAVMLYESISRGRQAVRWQEFWVDCGRNLGGITEDIGELLIHRRQDGRPPSLETILADLLRQIVRLTADLLQPPGHVKLMACVLLPEYETPASARRVRTLKAAVYNEAAGRLKSEFPSGTPNPGWNALTSAAPSVVPDTGPAPHPGDGTGQEFRSVVAFAVNIGGVRGKGLAVVCIEATEPNFFTEERLRQQGFEAAVFPYIKLVGIAILAESKGRLPW